MATRLFSEARIKSGDERWCAEQPVNSERQLDLMEEMTQLGMQKGLDGTKSQTGARELRDSAGKQLKSRRQGDPSH